MGVNIKLEEAVLFLKESGFDPVEARRILEAQTVGPNGEYDVMVVLDALSNPQAHTAAQQNTQRALITTPTTGSEDEIAKVLVASLKNAGANAQKDDLVKAMEESARAAKEKEDLEIKAALQMSMTNQNGPQPMDVDFSGHPKMSDEDRAMAEAIEKSLESGQSAVVASNPTSMKREPGVPVGLKNVGNTCYVNSLLQTYFMLPTLRNAMLSYVPPPLPPKPVPAPAPAPAPAAADGASTPSSSSTAPTSPAPTTPSQTSPVAPTAMDTSAPPNSPVVERQAQASAAAVAQDGATPVQDAVPTSQEYKNSEIDTIEFMIELQRLFASLVLSSQKYVDPSHMLKKLKDKSGNTLKIGNQEDVVEFNDLILDTIQRGLNLNHNPNSEVNVNVDFIKNMFYGNSVQLISGKEEDASGFEISSDSVFNHLILRVGKELPDLFSSLDAHVCDTVDYTTEKGFKTKASSITWFKKVPPILMFQQSRVGYDPEKKTYQKSMAPLNFEKEIYMDRYMLENKTETSRIRGIVGAWRDELNKHEEELRKFTHYEGDCGLDQAMKALIRYYQQKNEESHTFKNIIDTLQADYQTESSNMRTLRDVIGNLRSQIATAYDHMKQSPYVLYAVWVHQGVAGSGHYWAFLTEPRTSKWMRFNDMRVSDVLENEVMNESIGGHANSSAYFLIYVEKSMLSQVANTPDIFNYAPDALPIPESLKVELAEANAKFQASLESAEKNNSETKVSKFIEKYQEKVSELQKKAQESYPQDHRLNSFWVFLISQQQLELVMADVVRQIYSVHFEKGIQMDIDSANFNGVKAHVGPETIDLAVATAADSSRIDPLKRQHRIFQQVAAFSSTGMNFMMDDRYEPALESLVWAITRNSEIENPAAKRTEELILFIRVLFLRLLLRLTQLAASHATNDTLLSIVLKCSQVLGSGDPITTYVALEINKLATVAGPPLGLSFQLIGNVMLIHQPQAPSRPPPAVPTTMSQEEETSLMDKFSEMRDRLINSCEDHFTLLRRMGLIFDAPPAAYDDTTQQTTTPLLIFKK